MTEENKGQPVPPADKEEKKGMFTAKLSAWQVIAALIFVGYLTYGKYQEMKEKSAPQPPAATVPAK